MSTEYLRRISPEQLRVHCTENDAWISIKGIVYDITKYITFHPGGTQQIMQAVGMDGTQLFLEVHPNVNYDQILAKNVVGVLTTSEPDMSIKRAIERKRKTEVTELEPKSSEPTVVMDWVQQTHSINFFFYTCPMGNPYLQIYPLLGKKLHLTITHSNYTFDFHLQLFAHLRWPPKFKIYAETGKIDIVFDKTVSKQWPDYGTMTTVSTEGPALGLNVYKSLSKKRITHDCFLLEFERVDGVLHNIPVVQYLELYGPDGICRKYGGIPGCVATAYDYQRYTSSHLFIIVKRYNTGNLSKYLVRLKKNDTITAGHPYTHLDFKALAYFKQFMMLVAGTGINPMLALSLFLLERKIKPCEQIVMVTFNHEEEDIILKKELKDFEKKEHRFKVDHVITGYDPNWPGLKGRIDVNMIIKFIKEGFKSNIIITRDILFFVCGPFGFLENTHKHLTSLNVNEGKMILFSTMEVTATNKLNFATY